MMKKILLLCLLALCPVLALGQSLRTTATLHFEYDANETIDAFRLYSRTNLAATLTPTQFPYTFQSTNANTPGWQYLGTYRAVDLPRSTKTVTLTNGAPLQVYVYSLTLTNLVPGRMFFTVTASNFWGEGDFTRVVRLPAPPSDQNKITIQ